MGMLVDGQWTDKWYDTKSTGGKFKRSESAFRGWVTADGGPGPDGQTGFKATRYGSHRRNKKIAKAVPSQFAAPTHITVGKTILKEPRHQFFRLAQRGDVIAKITRRQDAHLPAQTAAAAAIVGHGDDRSDMVGVGA